MPLYIYTGPGHSLSLSGRTLVAGQPTILEGRAADAAELHPDVHAYKPTKSKPGAAPKAEEARLAAAAATTESCPAGCGDETRVELGADWQDRVRAGEAIALAGCGNPWHYTESGRPLGDAAVQALVQTEADAG